jgi:hypothetical protein
MTVSRNMVSARSPKPAAVGETIMLVCVIDDDELTHARFKELFESVGLKFYDSTRRRHFFKATLPLRLLAWCAGRALVRDEPKLRLRTLKARVGSAWSSSLVFIVS